MWVCIYSLSRLTCESVKGTMQKVIIRTETESNLFLLSTQLSLYVQRYDNLGN